MHYVRNQLRLYGTERILDSTLSNIIQCEAN